MQGGEVFYGAALEQEKTSQGRILLIDNDARALEAYSSSFRREGLEVHAFVSFPEGLACLESEHFDLVVMKLREAPSSEEEIFWSVRSRSTAQSPSWHAAAVGPVTWMWRTWEHWSN